MLRLSGNFLYYYIFWEGNVLIDFLLENIYKMTLKVLRKHSQNASKKMYTRSVYVIWIYDNGPTWTWQHFIYSSEHTPTKFNKHKRLIWGLGLILTCHVRSFKFVCPLRCRNISKLLNGKSAHFHFKPHRKNKSLNTKTYFYLY